MVKEKTGAVVLKDPERKIEILIKFIEVQMEISKCVGYLGIYTHRNINFGKYVSKTIKIENELCSHETKA